MLPKYEGNRSKKSDCDWSNIDTKTLLNFLKYGARFKDYVTCNE